MKLTADQYFEIINNTSQGGIKNKIWERGDCGANGPIALWTEF